MTKVSVHNETPEKAPEPNWQALFDAVENETEKKISPLAVIFVSEDKSKELNTKYRGKKSSTNILSFQELRELYICANVVKKEAEKNIVDYKDWMTRIIVHGILHLEGFGHDTDSDASYMEDAEQRVLKRIGISIL